MMERMRKRMMEDTKLYNPELMGENHDQTKAIYGPIPGIEPGATYPDRKACAAAGVHAVIFAGIHAAKNGACSVCLSNGYEDDEDHGDFVIYTGTGGQSDSFSGDHEQVANQSFKHQHNASLLVSKELKIPLRVVRGVNPKSIWAPVEGYRYDGLYLIEKAEYAKGANGFIVCRFEFRRKQDQPPIPLKPY